MKTILIIFVIIFLMNFAAQNVVGDVESCQKCMSEKSWDDCNGDMTSTSCSGRCGSKTCDSCFKTQQTIGEKTTYAKGCTLEKVCEAFEDNNIIIGHDETLAWCCSGSDCNGLSSTQASLGLIASVGLLIAIAITFF